MKHKTFILLLAFMTLLLTACQEKAPTRKSSSSSNNLSCSGQAYWTTPGCAGYCQYNPAGCNGGTVAGTVGGTTGGTTGTTGTTTGGTSGGVNNCLINPYSYQCYCQTYPYATGCSSGVGATYPNWGVMYPPTGSAPDDSGSTCLSYLPSGVSQAYEPRKGTVTVTGGQWYNPASGANNLYNTSTTLKSVAQAKMFYQTDSMLKVRFKVRPQPHAANTTNTCYGRATGQSYIAGYHKLKFNVNLVGVRADNTTGEDYLGTIEGHVNSCTSAIDLSPYVGMYPGGVYLKITDVQSNQGAWPANYNTYGFRDGNTWKTVRQADCWVLDIEVAADGTKTFD